MIEILCLSIIIILVFLTGQAFRKQYKKNNIANCLAMLVVMTMSTTVGILVATWIPDMVLSTIISIIISVALAVILTYKLPVKILIESLTMLFMGAMMGAMLSLMTSNYAMLSVVFFTIIYIISTITAIGLWNKEEYPVFRKAVPFHVIGAATIAVVTLVGFTLFASFETNPNKDNETIVEQDHHHH